MAVLSLRLTNSKLKAAYSAAIKIVSDAFFPEFCLVCGREGRFICSRCLARTRIDVVRSSCPFCQRVTLSGSVCRYCARWESLDGAVALAHYAEPAVRGLIKNWKYASDRRCAGTIKKLAGQIFIENFFPDLPWVLVPASLQARRARERGFDQARELAFIFSKQTGWPIYECLVRVKSIRPQARAGLDRYGVGELRGLYKVNGEVPKHVLLVDDVLTTGATLDAAAYALKRAGAFNVWALTMARGK